MIEEAQESLAATLGDALEHFWEEVCDRAHREHWTVEQRDWATALFDRLVEFLTMNKDITEIKLKAARKILAIRIQQRDRAIRARQANKQAISQDELDQEDIDVIHAQLDVDLLEYNLRRLEGL